MDLPALSHWLSNIHNTIGNIGMLELAAVLARLGLCSVLLCWMEWMALGMERLQSPPFDFYATINNILVHLSLVLQSSSKCKPVSGSTSALPFVVLDPQYYREH